MLHSLEVALVQGESVIDSGWEERGTALHTSNPSEKLDHSISVAMPTLQSSHLLKPPPAATAVAKRPVKKRLRRPRPRAMSAAADQARELSPPSLSCLVPNVTLSRVRKFRSARFRALEPPAYPAHCGATLPGPLALRDPRSQRAQCRCEQICYTSLVSMSSSLTAEQRERIARNKELAIERRMAAKVDPGAQTTRHPLDQAVSSSFSLGAYPGFLYNPALTQF